jgi:hypothetical protein
MGFFVNNKFWNDWGVRLLAAAIANHLLGLTADGIAKGRRMNGLLATQRIKNRRFPDLTAVCDRSDIADRPLPVSYQHLSGIDLLFVRRYAPD